MPLFQILAASIEPSELDVMPAGAVTERHHVLVAVGIDAEQVVQLGRVPVHGQHRGRVFLPFADDDPKTAEVMAKVLLLARDAEIRDPTILEQLRG